VGHFGNESFKSLQKRNGDADTIHYLILSTTDAQMKAKVI